MVKERNQLRQQLNDQQQQNFALERQLTKMTQKFDACETQRIDLNIQLNKYKQESTSNYFKQNENQTTLQIENSGLHKRILELQEELERVRSEQSAAK